MTLEKSIYNFHDIRAESMQTVKDFLLLRLVNQDVNWHLNPKKKNSELLFFLFGIRFKTLTEDYLNRNA